MNARLTQLLRGSLLLVVVPVGLHAQLRYHDPLPAITRILDAPPTPAVLPSPDRSKLLLMEQPGLPSISLVAGPELRLAGERLNPRNSAPSRMRTYSTMIVQPIPQGDPRRIVVPFQARVGNALWSPDAAKVAFTMIEDGGVSLWLAEASTGAIRMLSGPTLNAAFGQPCRWLPSSSALVCLRIPAGRRAAPETPAIPLGPVVQESEGEAAGNATYEDLLQNPHDEALFEYHFTSQLAVIPLSGSDRLLGAAGLHSDVQVSPDGKYLLVQTLHRPFSYLVPWQRFPRRTEVWDLNGTVVKVLFDAGLQEKISRSADGVVEGPRAVFWRGDTPATLGWVEAQDGGNPATPAKVRDRILLLAPPFAGKPVTLVDLEFRSRGVVWGRGLAMVNERWQKSRQSRTWIVDPETPARAPRMLFQRSSEDRYADPGDFLTQNGPGGPLLLTSKDGRFAFLSGAGASPEGDRPFLDRLELATGKTLRLWRSEAPYYEAVSALIDPDAGRFLTQRESLHEPPNYYIRDLRRAGAAQLIRLTSFRDPAPEFAGVTRQLITYQRGDGVQLSATLYLPPGYEKNKGRLPFFFWAYPREFQSARAASQVVGSPYRFSRPSGASHLFLLLAGYGVLDGPTMPIVAVGGKEPNDNYVEQLVASAEAAVEKVVALGVADSKRIGVGGHSYGAFMTANLLAHSDLFRAGIARSGAYNRTLTPFGFQSEDRSYWEAEDVYNRMSPFNYADKIKEPLLLIHGMADDNSGTFPIQSERLYAALKGNGAKVRLVMLPAEAHGYRARESVGHTLYEMVSWMDRYVKRDGASMTP
jgi:dipeptidyl aminopeptidase/acylaminoacyl peptidase